MNKKPIDLKSLGVRKSKINALLADEPRRWARKRLIAVQAVLAGKDFWAAAHAARATPERVRIWMGRLREGGLRGLLTKKRSHRPYPLKMTAQEIAAARREIDKYLRTQLRGWDRKRLTAVRVLLGGKTARASALSVGVTPGAVSRWFHLMRNQGCAALLDSPPVNESCLAKMSANRIAHIQGEIERLLNESPKPQPRGRQRLRAVLLALSGHVKEATDVALVYPATVRRWLCVAYQHGPAALLEKRHPGRPRKGTEQ